MVYRTYILYSKSINKYYTGFTSLSVQNRLAYHLSKHKGFTSLAKDWIVLFENSFDEKREALSLEMQIKKRGAKRFLDNR